MHSCYSPVYDSTARVSDGDALESSSSLFILHNSQLALQVKPSTRKNRQLYGTSKIHLLKSRNLRLRRRVRTFEEESEILKDYTVSVLLEKEKLEKDLAKIRVLYYEELGQAKQSRIQLQETQVELNRLNHRFAETERFILALVDLGLDLPVLREAISSVLRDCQPGEDALLSAIQKAATTGDSTWSTSFHSMEPPRTVDHYLSALDLTISARKELKEKARVAQFWKTLARSDPANADIMTPSSSGLDQIQKSSRISCSPMDDLICQLREALLAKQAGHPDCGMRKSGGADPNSPSYPKSDILYSPPSPLHPSFPSVPSETPLSVRSPSVGQHCVSHIPKRSRSKDQSFSSPDTVALATKEPGFCPEIIVNKNMQSLSGAARRLSDPNLPLKLSPLEEDEAHNTKVGIPDGVLSMSPPSTNTTDNLRSPPVLKRMSYPFSTIPSTAARHKHIDATLGANGGSATGTLRACQALLSLERICAAFSSSSSLESSEEGNMEPTPPSWLTDSNSSDSSTDELKSDASCTARPMPVDSVVAGDSGRNSRNANFPASRDVTLVNVTENRDQNTMSPPVVTPSKHAPAKKTVKWATPLSPERDRSGSITSTTTTSSSMSFGSLGSTSSSEAQPFTLGRVRPRSSSTPSPSPTVATVAKSATPSNETTLLKPSRISRPKVAFTAPPPTKLSQPPRIRPRSTSIGSLRSKQPITSPTRLRLQSSFIPPNIPPRSPLRPKSPSMAFEAQFGSPRMESSSQEQDVSIFQRMGAEEQGAAAGSRALEEVKISSLPQSLGVANTRVYDYTKPVMPLKVVKKSPGLLPKKIPVSSPVKARPGSINKSEVSSASSPQPSSPPPNQRLRHPIHPITPSFAEDSLSAQDSTPSPSPGLNNTVLSTSVTGCEADEDPSFPSHCSGTGDTDKRLSVDSTSTTSTDSQSARKSFPVHVIPPKRTSSMPPKVLQAPLKRPQFGLLQPLQPHGTAQRKLSQKDESASSFPSTEEPIREAGKVEREKALPLPASSLPTPQSTPPKAKMVKLSAPPPASTPSRVPPKSKTLRADTTSNSPLAKLRLSIMPPSAVVRSLSSRTKRMHSNTEGSGGSANAEEVVQPPKLIPKRGVHVRDGKQVVGSKRGILGNLSPKV